MLAELFFSHYFNTSKQFESFFKQFESNDKRGIGTRKLCSATLSVKRRPGAVSRRSRKVFWPGKPQQKA